MKKNLEKTRIAFEKEEVRAFTGVCVVVDLFRFSCTVACLIKSGKKELKIFSDPELAAAHYRNSPDSEIFSEMALPLPDKFDNSPYKALNFSSPEKSAVIVTNSGSKAVMNSVRASEILIAGFHNLPFLSEYLKKSNKEILLVPACIFYDRNHVEDFLACEGMISFLDGRGKVEDFMMKIHDTPRVLELMQIKPETAKQDLKLIMKIGNLKTLPRAEIKGVYASVKEAL